MLPSFTIYSTTDRRTNTTVKLVGLTFPPTPTMTRYELRQLIAELQSIDKQLA